MGPTMVPITSVAPAVGRSKLKATLDILACHVSPIKRSWPASLVAAQSNHFSAYICISIFQTKGLRILFQRTTLFARPFLLHNLRERKTLWAWATLYHMTDLLSSTRLVGLLTGIKQCFDTFEARVTPKFLARVSKSSRPGGVLPLEPKISGSFNKRHGRILRWLAQSKELEAKISVYSFYAVSGTTCQFTASGRKTLVRLIGDSVWNKLSWQIVDAKPVSGSLHQNPVAPLLQDVFVRISASAAKSLTISCARCLRPNLCIRSL